MEQKDADNRKGTNFTWWAIGIFILFAVIVMAFYKLRT
jgi:ABC-type multidrug transport system permease subunit